MLTVTSGVDLAAVLSSAHRGVDASSDTVSGSRHLTLLLCRRALMGCAVIRESCLNNDPVLSTERLVLRHLDFDDAPFVLELVNEPGWLQYIGDKGVRSLDDAKRYLQTGPLSSYERFGFGLYKIERREDHVSLGMCGLLKRDALEHPDIGFALRAEHAGRGYALEAASATLQHAKALGMDRLLAITTPKNHASQKLLRKLGFRFDKEITMGAEPLHLFALSLDAHAMEDR